MGLNGILDGAFHGIVNGFESNFMGLFMGFGSWDFMGQVERFHQARSFHQYGNLM